MQRWILFFCSFLLAAPVFAQAPARKVAFEIASVKPSSPAGGPLTMGYAGGRFTAANVPLRLLIQLAYQPSNGSGLLPDQLVGAPDWAASDRYDIEGKADDAARSLSLAQMWPMVQSLLEERFKLKTHRETRELPVYDLVVGASGVKMKRSPDQTPPEATAGTPLNPNAAEDRLRGAPQATSAPSPAGPIVTISGTALPMEQLRRLLQSYSGRPVIDRTNLRDLFDFRLQFTQQPLSANAVGAPAAGQETAPSAPSLFTAIEQLGLKLESAKGPVEVLVIDSVQKPSPN